MPGRIEGRRVVITGGAGFIGSHLCERLLEQGANVICVDNFFTGSDHNIAHLLDHSCFTVRRHDVIDPFDEPADQIFNLASPAAPKWYQLQPVQTMKVGFLGMLNVLDLAERYGARLVHASTSEVYGDPQEHPQTESYWGNVNPIGMRACYNEGKRAAEALGFSFRHERKVDVRIARIFNTYGPRMAREDGRVIPNFIDQALKGEDITVFGNGQQTRSFCYVDDLVSGLIALMDSERAIKTPVNLGNPTEVTIRQVADEVISQVQSRSQVVHHPLPDDDPRKRRPSIELAKELLDWRPTVALREGLRRTIASLRLDPSGLAELDRKSES